MISWESSILELSWARIEEGPKLRIVKCIDVDLTTHLATSLVNGRYDEVSLFLYIQLMHTYLPCEMSPEPILQDMFQFTQVIHDLG